MRKFKVKNRRKRKYVKKNELAASLSQAQSLTLGVVPMLLMAIAFFATFLISNPQIATNAVSGLPTMPEISLPQISMPTIAMPEISMPTISLPKLEWSFELPKFDFPTLSMPQLPQVSFPEVTFPTITMPEVTVPEITFPTITLPTITLPDIRPVLNYGFNATINGVTNVIDTCIRGLTFVDQLIVNALVHGFTVTGQFIASSISAVITSIINTSVFINQTAISAAGYVTQLTIQILHTARIWAEISAKAVVDGWNAFVWFIGTPFRYIAHATEEIIIALTPFFDFLSQSFANAMDQLRSGGDTLIKGTDYVSSSVSAGK